MTKTEKAAAVAELRGRFQAAKAVLITEYRGITVSRVNEVRRALEKEGASYKVVKNTLAELAAKGTDFEVLVGQFKGPLSVTFVSQDPVSAAKVLVQFAKTIPALVVRGGALGGRLLSAADVEALSKLPPREQLLGQVVGVLVAPLRNLVGVLSGVPRSFVQVLHAVQEKKAA